MHSFIHFLTLILQLIEEIFKDNISEENYEALNARVHELRRGHLATSPEDSAPYAIFWYEGQPQIVPAWFLFVTEQTCPG